METTLDILAVAPEQIEKSWQTFEVWCGPLKPSEKKKLKTYNAILEKAKERILKIYVIPEYERRGMAFNPKGIKETLIIQYKKKVKRILVNEEIIHLTEEETNIEEKKFEQLNKGLFTSFSFPEKYEPDHSYLYFSHWETGEPYFIFNASPRTAPVKMVVKTPMSLALQQHGYGVPKKYSVHQMTFDDLMETQPPSLQAKAKEHEVNVIGPVLEEGELKTLFSILKLFSMTNYDGNFPAVSLPNDNSFQFTGQIPRIKITPAELYDACFVAKDRTAQGWNQFRQPECEDRLRDLRNLRDKKFLWLYETEDWSKVDRNGNPTAMIRKAVSSVIDVYEDYQKDEIDDSDKEMLRCDGTIQKKLKYLIISLAPVCIDNIKKKFVLKPADYIQEIELKLKGKRVSKYLIYLADYLILKATLGNMEITIEEENLAAALKMQVFIKKKDWKRIRGTIKTNCTILEDLGYLLDHRVLEEGFNKHYHSFVLNPNCRNYVSKKS